MKQGDIAWYSVHLTFQPNVVNASVIFYAVTPPTTVSLNRTMYFQNGTVYSVFESTQDLGNGGSLWPVLASPNLQKGRPSMDRITGDNQRDAYYDCCKPEQGNGSLVENPW